MYSHCVTIYIDSNIYVHPPLPLPALTLHSPSSPHSPASAADGYGSQLARSEEKITSYEKAPAALVFIPPSINIDERLNAGGASFAS